MNLLNETVGVMKGNGLKHEDIIFIGSEDSGYSCSWKEFTDLANVDFDAGFGSQQVATDLVIVFKDGSRLYRSEYDGAESWEYVSVFRMPSVMKPIKSLIVVNGTGWQTLETINGESN